MFADGFYKREQFSAQLDIVLSTHTASSGSSSARVQNNPTPEEKAALTSLSIRVLRAVPVPQQIYPSPVVQLVCLLVDDFIFREP